MPAKLSTHVLDTMNGRPASGVPISLHRRSPDGTWTLMFETRTNADGRTDAPLLSGANLRVGIYELRFQIGAYFASASGAPATSVPTGGTSPGFPSRLPFLDEIPIRFGIADPTTSYHVPLLATPWSYSTYRGS
jgi:5-hydroxyisourate hydrolase